MLLEKDFLDSLCLGPLQLRPVHGGDINEAWQLTGANGLRYFLKMNDQERFPGMFAAEAEGLEALRRGSEFRVPGVLGQGVWQDRQFLLLEWIESGTPDGQCWENSGRSLARIHRVSQPCFGWDSDNYIGSLPQTNGSCAEWPRFYAERRLLPLAEALVGLGSFTARDLRDLEKLCFRLPELFPPEPPALLHGDLWSGNFICGIDRRPSLIDPAVHYGNREMDLGMTKLFGGFHPRFYEAYQEEYPLQPGWEKRVPLTQLYPVLVHAVLFGGHYSARARGIIRDHTC